MHVCELSLWIFVMNILYDALSACVGKVKAGDIDMSDIDDLSFVLEEEQIDEVCVCSHITFTYLHIYLHAYVHTYSSLSLSLVSVSLFAYTGPRDFVHGTRIERHDHRGAMRLGQYQYDRVAGGNLQNRISHSAR